MNKYYCRIPYSYMRYGTLSCNVYAEDSYDAEDLAMDYNSRQSVDYDDSDNDGDMEFDYNDMTVELEEEDVDSPNESSNESEINLAIQLPSRFIEDLVLL